MKTTSRVFSAAVVASVALAGCTTSSKSPSTTTPVTSPTQSTTAQSSGTPSAQTSAPTSAQTSTTPSATANISALAQYQAWTNKYHALASKFMDAASAGNFAQAASALGLIGAHAKQGKTLPSVGIAKADQEWQNAMDDLITAAAIGAPAIRARDTDKLLDAVDLITQAGDHITSWSNQFG